MARLRDLEAVFLRYEQREEDGKKHVCYVEVDSMADAHGVQFLCPLCFEKNHGNVGTHTIICWFAGMVPLDAAPGPGRWNPRGHGIDDLTFIPPGAVSVMLTHGCRWHGFVANGIAV